MKNEKDFNSTLKYKYQVVVHTPYYPSSILFSDYEEAVIYYNSVRGAEHEECLVTLCEILEAKGENEYPSEIDYYIERNE